MIEKKRILVVDDEAGILRFVSTSLGLAGFDVITTGSGQEALQFAETQNPDLILLDILMQPMSGFDVLERLRRFSQIPVIVFTAQRDIAEKAMKHGADGFIIKPFVPDELTKKIRTVLNSLT